MNARTRNAIPTNTATCYEVALVRDGEAIHVYGYTARKSKHGICTVINGHDVTSLLTESEVAEIEATDADVTYSAKYGFKLATGLYIRFTGNTERQVAA